MASIRKSDGRIWLEVGEFQQLPYKLKSEMMFSPAGLADSYIIAQHGKNILYVPIVDAKQFLKAIPACVPAMYYQNASDKEKKTDN